MKLILALSENWTLLDPRDIRAQVETAVLAEDAGFDGVMISEHIVMGQGADANGIAKNPRDFAAPGNQHPSMPWPSNIVLLSALATATRTMRVIGAAVIAPLRHPLLLAKELATLDLLAEGRLIVLPNVSWHESEYKALGVPFHRRGDILDEQLDILQTLWSGSGAGVSYAGEFFQFDDVWLEPSSLRPTGPTLWFGGGVHDRMLRRLTRYGSGYLGMGPTSRDDQLRIDQAITGAGRDITELEFVGGIAGRLNGPDDIADLDEALTGLAPQLAAGLRTFVIKPSQYLNDVAGFSDFAHEAISKVNAIAQDFED